jgi:hypothetical protein
LYNCSIGTPGATPEGEEVLGDIGTTPCNTPKQRGLRRRSTVVAAKGGKIRDEVADEGGGAGEVEAGGVGQEFELCCVKSFGCELVDAFGG